MIYKVNRTTSLENPHMYNVPRDPHSTVLFQSTEVNINHMKLYFQGGGAESTMKHLWDIANDFLNNKIELVLGDTGILER